MNKDNVMRRTAYGLAGMMAALLTGCASLDAIKGEHQGLLYDRAGVDVISEAAGVRMAFFRDPTSTERFCLGPGPDVSVAASDQLGIAVAGRSITTGAGESTLALGGRNPQVLIVRELMYRACELAMNLNSDATETKAIYLAFLAAAKDMPPSTTSSSGSSSVSSPPVGPAGK